MNADGSGAIYGIRDCCFKPCEEKYIKGIIHVIVHAWKYFILLVKKCIKVVELGKKMSSSVISICLPHPILGTQAC